MSDADFQFYKGLAVAAALGLALLLQRLRPYHGSIGALVRNWRVNGPLALFNLLLIGVVCGGCVCLVADWADTNAYGLFNTVPIEDPWRILLSVIVLDFVAYAWHRANHRMPLLWRFHAVHHSDTVYDASTALRFHPGEIALSLAVRALVVLAFGLPIVGILAFEIVYAFFNFFEHGDIRLGARLERVMGCALVTPAVHRKHHSIAPNELNTNFGTIFSLWDRAFGTHTPSSSTERVVVGLPADTATDRGVPTLLAMPFGKSAP